MDDRHFRAVIRAALRAGGFAPRMAEVAAAERRSRAVGLRLRNLLAENLPPFSGREVLERMAGEDSLLWNQLPSMLAFGHQQAVVFRRVIHPDRPSLPAASLLPVAAFSAGISLLDYLADVRGLAEPIFEVLDGPTVAGLFGGRPAGTRLEEAYQQTDDVALRLLFALVAICGSGVRALHRRHGDDLGRDDLLATLARLHAAQQAVTFPAPGSATGPVVAEAVSTKSVLPFVAAHQLVELFDPPGAGKRSGRELARRIGEAVAVTDDVVDLLSDWRSGAPNTLIPQGHRPGDSLADGWLYRTAEQAAARIVAILSSASLLDPAPPPGAPAAAARFATVTIARWVGWREELSPPSVHAFRRAAAPRALLEPCTAALGTLLAQQRTGYPEAVHWMTVPRLEAGGARLEAHPAIDFQRAIALDALLDAYAAGLDVPVSVLGQEASLLLQAKRDDVRGGWGYLRDVPELPPDADDLAMVLQVLSRCGGRPLAAACDQAVNLALAAGDRGEPLSTWILDPDEAPERRERFEQYLTLTRSAGVHPDVVANLLYAVALQGDESWKRAADAIPYLESAQEGDGSWRSRWYWGRHYGTYRAVLALAAVAPGSPALARAEQFLVSGQHDDGGWGAEGRSDPLSTAFAALALAARVGPGPDRPLRAAVAYLLAGQQADGSWPACPFIAFPRVGGPGVHIYSSSTMTTSFCLKAVLAARGSHPAGRPAGRRAGPARAYRPPPGPPTAADWS